MSDLKPVFKFVTEIDASNVLEDALKNISPSMVPVGWSDLEILKYYNPNGYRMLIDAREREEEREIARIAYEHLFK